MSENPSTSIARLSRGAVASLAMAVLTIVAAFVQAAPASAFTVGGHDQGWRVEPSYAALIGVTCRTSSGSIEINTWGGNQGNYYVRVWLHDRATGQTVYHGQSQHQQEGAVMIVGGGGADRTLWAGRGSYLVYVQVYYPSQTSWAGWVARYRNLHKGYFYELAAPVEPTCQLG